MSNTILPFDNPKNPTPYFMKIKVQSAGEAKPRQKQKFVKEEPIRIKGKLNIGIQVSVDQKNNISEINLHLSGKDHSLKVKNGDIMFQWDEMERLIEEEAKKLKSKKS